MSITNDFGVTVSTILCRALTNIGAVDGSGDTELKPGADFNLK